MSRRIVLGTWWVGFVACGLLLLAYTMRASSFGTGVPPVKGAWDGFFLAADGTLGGIQSDTLQQDFRRLEGDGMLFNLESGGLFNTCNFNATLARDDFITGTGVTRTGRIVFQADLGPLAGLGGEAVMAPEYNFVPARGNAGRVSGLLLHPFPSAGAPDIAGSYVGPFASHPDPISGAPGDPSFTGFGRLEIAERNARGSFAGRVEFFLESSPVPFLSWPFLATTDRENRVVWIAQGKAGRILCDGALVPMTNEQARIDGVFRISLLDGRTLYNAINVQAFSP